MNGLIVNSFMHVWPKDYICPGLHNGPFGKWFVATNPCSLHLSYRYEWVKIGIVSAQP